MANNKKDLNQIEYFLSGSGSPEGVVDGAIGALFFRLDENTESNVYSKQGDDGGNTNWFFPEGGWVQASVPSLTLSTNNPGGGATFDPSVTGATTPVWTFEDASTLTTLAISTTANGLDGTTQDVVFTADDLTVISAVDAANDNIVGTVDLSLLTGLSQVNLSGNASFTGVTLPAGATWSTLNFATSGLTSLDLSNQIMSSTTLSTINCTALTSIITTGISGTISNVLIVNATGLTTLDLSGITTSGGNFGTNGCSNLTTLTLPPSGTIKDMTVNGMTSITSLNGSANTLDVSMFTINDKIEAHDNPWLTTVILGNNVTIDPSHSMKFENCAINSYVDLTNVSLDDNFTEVNFGNNALSTANVDQMLIDIDALVTAGTGTITFSGGTNGAPTGGAANANVVSLQGKGYTVNHN